jgi:hypothetical protein
MRPLAPWLALTAPLALALVLPSAHADKPRKPTPALPAAQYPLHDAHPAEHVTVAAEPCDTKETTPNTRLDYLHHGFLPIRVIVTNDSDAPLTLDDARIQFITADQNVIPAATDDELQRRLFSSKSAAPTHIPLPAPIPSINIKHKPVDRQIIADDQDFGFKSTTIAPHSTAAGYLYYDIRALDEPVLDHAQLELRRVHPEGSTKDLFTFDIPLQPAKPTASTASSAGNKTDKADEKVKTDKKDMQD